MRLSRLKRWWYDQWDMQPPVEELPDEVETELIAAIEPASQPPTVKSGVRKSLPKHFIPGEHRHGGRVVKAMPRSLRQMKELAEKTDD